MTSFLLSGLRCWHCHTSRGFTEKHVCDQSRDGISLECVEPDQRCMIKRSPPGLGNRVTKKCEFPPAAAIIGTCAPSTADGAECYCETDNCNKDQIDGVGAYSMESSASSALNFLSWLPKRCVVIFSVAYMIYRL
ncbi:hypothetical protein Ocin01_12855 [Orchesella cincta]|uniref:Protein quiver n=1 Tax=Orchesella cincta TaxID=48709 RepID=A0A1D2MLQ6_ORCCI|nr:hypothetical protein Ocin01_14973 [Orchesella cincta]ODM93821.1 hypothetical protein Ocin01_12855 [Orchesella cincta]